MIKKILTVSALAILVSACGMRSIGNNLDDKMIPMQVSRAIKDAHVDLNSTTSHIVTTSYNGIVLLAGQTPRRELKELAGKAAKNVVDVKKVYNEITIEQPTTMGARSNDAFLTSAIKTRLLAYADVPSAKIKVVTENGVVYLMGILTRAEANRATNVVKDVAGVQRIVRLFEYID